MNTSNSPEFQNNKRIWNRPSSFFVLVLFAWYLAVWYTTGDQVTSLLEMSILGGICISGYIAGYYWKA